MRYDSFAHKGFQEKGMTYVIVTRTDDAGWLHAGVFLLDLYCLGVKDAFAAEMNLADWPEQLGRLIPAGNRLALHPACARKLVEGAVHWNEVGERLREAAHNDDPHRAVDFGDNPVDANRLYASAWCRGFLRTVDAWPAAWKSALDRPELRRHFDAIATVAAYAGGAAPAGVIAPAEAEELPGYVGAAVLALYSALLKERKM